MEKVSSKVLNSFSVGLLLIGVGFAFALPGVLAAAGDEDSIWLKVMPVLMLLGSAIIAAMAFSKQEGESTSQRNAMNLIAFGAIAIAVFAFLVFDSKIKNDEPAYLELAILLGGFVVVALGLKNLAGSSELNGLEYVATAAWVAAAAVVAFIIFVFLTESADKEMEALYKSSSYKSSRLSYGELQNKIKSLEEASQRYSGLMFASMTIVSMATAAAACGLRVLAGSSDNYTNASESTKE